VEVIPETYDVDLNAPFTPPDFSKAAKSPAFRDAVRDFTRRYGKPASDVFPEEVEGVVVFSMPPAEAERVVAREQAKLIKKGVFVCRTGEFHGGLPAGRGKANVGLFPTGDVFDVLAVLGAGGGFEGVAAAVTRLRRIAADDPFRLTFISFDAVDGAFLKPPKDALKLAERIDALCPDATGDGEDDDLAVLARLFKKSRRLFLWWD
jgi:hypothetical protein